MKILSPICAGGRPTRGLLYRLAALIICPALLFTSCARKPKTPPSHNEEEIAEHTLAGEPAEKGENEDDEQAPDSGDIGEDAIAFLRSTKVASGAPSSSNCPQCPIGASSAQVFRFDNVVIDRVVPSDDTCEVDVRLFATFEESHGGVIAGGLTAWIPAEQRAAYERGETPPGQQVYPVQIIYRKKSNGWQPIEFTPASP